MSKNISRRNVLASAAALGLASCAPNQNMSGSASAGHKKQAASAREEYVWISANANLPLFVAHDHPALKQIGRELGVRTTIVGPDTIDIPGLIAAIEETASRRPAGMMIVGWDPSALVPAIDQVVDSGIPVVCVDADVPASKRLAFIGTDWYEIGLKQGQQMLKALDGRKGRIAMLGLIEQYIDQRAFEGFRSVIAPSGLMLLEPQQDKGNQGESARVASALLQAHPDLVGFAGFDSETGAGVGQAIKELGKAGTVCATCVDAEPQQLQFIKDGVLSASVGQKRSLFTYQGVKALYDVVHNTLKFTSDDAKAAISPIPVYYNTGTFIVDRGNVDIFLSQRNG